MSSLRDALVIVAAGLALSFFFVRPVLRAWRGRRWPHAAGTVTGSRVDNEPSGLSVAKARYFVHVSYRYDAGGNEMAGKYSSATAPLTPEAIALQEKVTSCLELSPHSSIGLSVSECFHLNALLDKLREVE